MSTTQEEIVAGIAATVEEVTGIDAADVTIGKSFIEDLEIDSLSLVEITVQLEDKYGVKIPDEDMAGLKTVRDAVAYVQKMEAEQPRLAADVEAKLAGHGHHRSPSGGSHDPSRQHESSRGAGEDGDEEIGMGGEGA